MRRYLAIIVIVPLIIIAASFAFWQFGKGNSISFASLFQDDLIIKLFVLVDIAILTALVILWRRRKQNIRKAEKVHLKENISRLRDEKIQVKRDKKKGLLRQKLQSSSNIGKLNKSAKIKEARKMSISTGEIDLAAKIKALDKLKKSS